MDTKSSLNTNSVNLERKFVRTLLNCNERLFFSAEQIIGVYHNISVSIFLCQGWFWSCFKVQTKNLFLEEVIKGSQEIIWLFPPPLSVAKRVRMLHKKSANTQDIVLERISERDVFLQLF